MDEAVGASGRDRLLRPGAAVDVVGGLAGGTEVGRQHGELQRGAALQEQDGEVIGHSGQRPEVGQGVHVDGVCDLNIKIG